MQLLLVLIFITTAIGAEYDYEYPENLQNEDLLSEIFQQSSFELQKTDYLDTENLNDLEENVRKKRLQLTHYSEQGNHFPVFDFDTKPKAKRTTAAPEVTETTTTSGELPPIKKFTFKLLENPTTTESPAKEVSKEVSEENLEAENLVEPDSETQ